MPEERTRRPARSPARRDQPTARPIGATLAAPTGSRGTTRRSQPPPGSGRLGFVLLAVFLAIAGVFASYLTIRLHNQSVAAQGVSPFAPATHAVVIVLDGADPALLQRVPMPNLHTLRDNGVTYTSAWAGQLETTPAAAAASVGTGAFPRSHKIIGDVWYSSQESKVTRVTLPDSVIVGGIDTVMEPTGVSTLAAALKSHTPAARVLSVAGTNCASASAAATWTADYVVCAQRRQKVWAPLSVAGHELPTTASHALSVRTAAAGRGPLGREMQGWTPGAQDDWITRVAVGAMRDTHPTLTFVNYPEPAIAQKYVPAGRTGGVEATILRGLDADIGRLVRELRREGVYRSTIFVVTAGRAFEPIRTSTSLTHLSNAIVAAGGEATYLTGDGSAFIGLRDPLQAQPVAQALQSENSSTVDAVFFKVQSGNAWSYAAQYLDPSLSQEFARACSYLLSTMQSAAAPDVVVVYRPYAGLAAPGASASSGSLGLAWPIEHVPFILSGHGVYAGRTSSFPARLVDIAPTLEAALGLQPDARDGVVLHDALYGDTSGSEAQAAQRAKLSPMVAALRQRSNTTSG